MPMTWNTVFLNALIRPGGVMVKTKSDKSYRLILHSTGWRVGTLKNPLMTGLSNTEVLKWMNENQVEVKEGELSK